MGVKIEHLCGWGVVFAQFCRGKATFEGLSQKKKISVDLHIFIHVLDTDITQALLGCFYWGHYLLKPIIRPDRRVPWNNTVCHWVPQWFWKRLIHSITDSIIHQSKMKLGHWFIQWHTGLFTHISVSEDKLFAKLMYHVNSFIKFENGNWQNLTSRIMY